MQNQIKRIKDKLQQIKELDKDFNVEGSNKHQYKFNPKKTEQELTEFENKYNISLPEGYREFLKQIGNGEAGPDYGMVTLEEGLFLDMDYKDENELIDISKEFPISGAWNPIDEEGYYDDKWVNGLLRICNYGCGIYFCLVVNGAEHGNMYVDDRCNDAGIYPANLFFNRTGDLTFLDWYENWLDEELEHLKDSD